MVKKLLILLLLLMLPLTCGAAEQRVFDNSGLFAAHEIAALEAQIQRMRQETGMDFVVLTDGGAEYSSDDGEAERYSLEFANRFYAEGGFGAGEEESGFLFFIDMSNRLPTAYTYGAMIDYVSDARLAQMMDRVGGYLRGADYGGAARAALEEAESFLRQGIPEGNYRYDVLTGKRLTARHKVLTSTELVGALLVGLAAALFTVKAVVSRYKLKGGAYTYDSDENGQQELLEKEDQYLTSTVSSVNRVNPPSGGSGGGGGGTRVHSSGGRSFGGGSGSRF